MKRIIILLAVLVLSHSVVCGQENDDYFSFYYNFSGLVPNFTLDNTFHRTASKIVNQYLPEDKNDISKLWIKQVEILSSSEVLDLDSINLNSLDISNILEYNDSANYKTPGYFCTYMGALGENFERIDFHFYSARKVKNQDYALKILMRKGGVIDTLIGDLKLIKALKVPELGNGENILIFLYDFNFRSQNPENGVSIKGTSSITFLMENGIACNFWSASGDYSEYIRTFVGYYMDSKSDKKLNCIFALEVAGLYYYLPFCDNFYYFDEENYAPDYYLIKEEYKQFGWQDFNERDPDKYDWWKK